MLDGYLKIKTKLDNSGVDKGIVELENKIKKLETDNSNLSKEESSLQDEITKYDKLCEQADRYKEKIKQIKNEIASYEGKSIPAPEWGEYQGLSSKLTLAEKQYNNATKEVDKQASKLDRVYIKLDKIKSKQTENNDKIKQFKDKIEQINLKKVQEGMNNVGGKMQNIVGKLGKMTMAVFGIRTAFSAVRQAMNAVSRYNSQISTDFEYMRYCIANLLAPAVQWLVNLLYTVMAYVNYIAKAWFGINLFGNSSAKNFSKMQKSADGTAKSAKEIQKSLQGFDEINVLQDNSNDSSSGGGGVSTPSMDLSKMENIKIPKWLENFTKFCKPIIDFFKQVIDKYGPVAGGIMIIVGALGTLAIIKKVIKWLTGFKNVTKGVSADFTGLLNSLGKATEIIAILGGLSLVIESITELIKGFSESGLTLGEVAGLLGIVLGELAGAFIIIAGAMQLLNPSWQSIAGAVVILAGLALILTTVTSLIKAFSESGLTLGDVIGLLSTILVTIVGLMGAVALLGPMMTAGLIPFVVVITSISALLLVMAATLPTILDACAKFINSIAPVIITLIITINNCINSTIKALGVTLPTIIRSLGTLFDTIFKGIANIVNSVGNTVSKIINSVGNVIMTIFEGIRRIIKQIGDTITQVANTIIWFINNLGPSINNFVDNTIRAVTKLVNFVVSAIEYLINRVVDGLNGIASVINMLPGINIRRKSYVNIPRFQPRLATGGIVDIPGKGIDIGGAIAGEAGREGVLPLTNSETMAELGREIGKWVNVNNVLNNYMDGRLIQRGIAKRDNELAFATNR